MPKYMNHKDYIRIIHSLRRKAAAKHKRDAILPACWSKAKRVQRSRGYYKPKTKGARGRSVLGDLEYVFEL